MILQLSAVPLAELICTFGTPAPAYLQFLLSVLLSCCVSDAKKQPLSSEADLGGNLHPAGLAPALSAGLGNVPFRGAAFQLLGFNVTSNCTLTFALISH